MPILYSAQQIQGHINICGNSPWFNKRLQLGRTCIKGPKFCLSASNSERYLHKSREQLLHSLISFQPVNITVTYSCVPNLKLLLPSGVWSSFRMLLQAVCHVLKLAWLLWKGVFHIDPRGFCNNFDSRSTILPTGSEEMKGNSSS